MQKYLEETEIIDYNNKEVYALAMKLANGCKDDTQIAKKCFDEQLAFKLQENEFNLSENLVEPLPVIVETLRKYKGYDEMICHFPDIEIEALG